LKQQIQSSDFISAKLILATILPTYRIELACNKYCSGTFLFALEYR